MNPQELQERIEEINTQIDEGKTVDVTVEQEGESAQLEVSKVGDHSIARAPAAPPTTPVADAGINLDVSADNDISDAQIIEKITRASGKDTALGVPRVILTRDDANKVWVVVENCAYLTAGHTITVLAEDTTDLASVPRVFWAIIAPEELSLAAPVFHDLIYQCGGRLPNENIDPVDGKVFTRRETDDLFREIMKKAGIPRWKRTAAYLAVRSFGSFAWKG
jgi:hypothetical protein